MLVAMKPEVAQVLKCKSSVLQVQASNENFILKTQTVQRMFSDALLIILSYFGKERSYFNLIGPGPESLEALIKHCV